MPLTFPGRGVRALVATGLRRARGGLARATAPVARVEQERLRRDRGRRGRRDAAGVRPQGARALPRLLAIDSDVSSRNPTGRVRHDRCHRYVSCEGIVLGNLRSGAVQTCEFRFLRHSETRPLRSCVRRVPNGVASAAALRSAAGELIRSGEAGGDDRKISCQSPFSFHGRCAAA